MKFITRRQFLAFMAGTGLLSTLSLPWLLNGEKAKKPNVLFLVIDDLNDWVGVLGGHPDAKTPHIDALANDGVLFTNAHTPIPTCNPARTAVFTGLYPHTTGIYYNNQYFRKEKGLSDLVTIPDYFQRSGYKTYAAGKVFHGTLEADKWNEFWKQSNALYGPLPPQDKLPLNGIEGSGKFDWGALPNQKEDMGDWKVADWVIDKIQTLEKNTPNSPFFLAGGFFRPHRPMYAPQEYFDKFPLESITLPKRRDDDLSDIPAIAINDERRAQYQEIVSDDQYKKAVQAYLACSNFVDECVGRVVTALNSSAFADNTIVVLWSDHGWHLGEKETWEKNTLWEESTRSLFTLKLPKGRHAGLQIDQPVNLIDIYPTLTSYAGLKAPNNLDAMDLKPYIENPALEIERPAITSIGENNFTFRTKKWRYTVYEDGSEELYDHQIDPDEFDNLARNAEYSGVKQQLKTWLPAKR